MVSEIDWVQIIAEPLDVARAISFVADPVAGGVAVFLGTTRCEDSVKRGELVALDYEAYADMALRQLNEIAGAARDKWPVARLAILHRTGRVALAEPSVVIAVSCPHRGEAFDACRWIIDTLKKDVAIWKKEVWSDGSGTWVHPHEQNPS